MSMFVSLTASLQKHPSHSRIVHYFQIELFKSFGCKLQFFNITNKTKYCNINLFQYRAAPIFSNSACVGSVIQ